MAELEIVLHLQLEALWRPRNPLTVGKSYNNMGTYPDPSNIFLSSLKIQNE